MAEPEEAVEEQEVRPLARNESSRSKAVCHSHPEPQDPCGLLQVLVLPIGLQEQWMFLQTPQCHQDGDQYAHLEACGHWPGNS